MNISGLDHVVLTVRDVEASCDFYSRVLGFESVRFGDGWSALRFGDQKINLHSVDAPISPHAQNPTSGSADLCFITTTPIVEVVAHLRRLDVAILEGPVSRIGAKGPITSIYFRDPDSNLIEVSVYDGGHDA